MVKQVLQEGDKEHRSETWIYLRKEEWGFPGGPLVKKAPANAGDKGSIPSLGRFHMPQRKPLCCNHRACALDPGSTTTKAVHPRACAPQQEKSPQPEANTPQLESIPCSPPLGKAEHINKDPVQPKVNK